MAGFRRNRGFLLLHVGEFELVLTNFLINWGDVNIIFLKGILLDCPTLCNEIQDKFE